MAACSWPKPHPGFKVFVANQDRKGLAWMIVLHQGSGSPRRGTVASTLCEECPTSLDVRGVLRARPAFGIANAITQFDRGSRSA